MHVIRRLAHGAAAAVPPIARLRAQRDDLAARVRSYEAVCPDLDPTSPQADPAYRLYPPGHFYSPQPDLEEVRRRADRLFRRDGDVLGIDLHEQAQLDLLAELGEQVAAWPYGPDGDTGTGRHRYQPDNGYFGHTDGKVWYGLLRRRPPSRLIEIGSGWSTALVLDVLDQDGAQVDVTCVEPYPDRLETVASPADLARITLRRERAQDVDPAELAALGPGDVLFIDSTHVSRVGSDVNHLFFEVLPRLAPGVLVHVHDIAYPFEYPQEWVLEGRAWNEAYLLRALLVENPRWEVLLWPSMLWLRHPERMREHLGADTPVDGGSLWLRRC